MANGYEELIEHIQTYESNTFSASGSKITDAESQQIANKFIKIMMNASMDGEQISYMLEDIRDSPERE